MLVKKCKLNTTQEFHKNSNKVYKKIKQINYKN